MLQSHSNVGLWQEKRPLCSLYLWRLRRKSQPIFFTRSVSANLWRNFYNNDNRKIGVNNFAQICHQDQISLPQTQSKMNHVTYHYGVWKSQQKVSCYNTASEASHVYKSNWKLQKMVNLASFWKTEQCYQIISIETFWLIFKQYDQATYSSKSRYIFQVGSSIKCGQGVKLSKFYFYNASSRKCQAEIGCPVPLDDTSRGNRFFSKISCLKLCSDTYNHDCRYSSILWRKKFETFQA